MLILLDIDGTLIGESGQVADEIWSEVDRLRAAGARMAVCTGRTHEGVALEIARRLDPSAPHIFHNGALVCTAEGEVLDSSPISRGALSTLVSHARGTGKTLELYTTGGIFVDRITPACARHADVLDIEVSERNLRDVLENEQVIRAHWILRPAQFDSALEASRSIEGVNASSATSPALPGSVFISVTDARASKGSGAIFAAEHLGLELGGVIGVGDSDSDVPMLERVGHPFIMGDATADLRERFPCVGPVAEHGLLEALAYADRMLERAS